MVREQAAPRRSRCTISRSRPVCSARSSTASPRSGCTSGPGWWWSAGSTSATSTPPGSGSARPPTFVAVTLHIDNWRWAGVPVRLRAGKSLPVTTLEVVVELRTPPRPLFGGPGGVLPPPNLVRLRLQPDAGVELELIAKQPGTGDVATALPLAVDFRTVLSPMHAPYERIFADALAGDPAHFARMDTLTEAWRIVGPVLDPGTPPLPYPPGTWGPEAAAVVPGERGWHPVRGAPRPSPPAPATAAP
ncbi:hypothetical protein [Pseudonocardia asaccharolytica]|uniref:hypothetical protein n=1 Tax=Pseudonocardia asaccharolytica TaxID=54010 RepID=UPI0011BDF324